MRGSTTALSPGGWVGKWSRQWPGERGRGGRGGGLGKGTEGTWARTGCAPGMPGEYPRGQASSQRHESDSGSPGGWTSDLTCRLVVKTMGGQELVQVKQVAGETGVEALGADAHVQGVDLGRSGLPRGRAFPGLPQSPEDEQEPQGRGLFGVRVLEAGAPLKALPAEGGACGPAGCGGNGGEQGRQQAGTASARSLAERREEGPAGG